MPIPFPFDFKNPDYVSAFQWRVDKLRKIRQNLSIVPLLKTYYRDNPAQFICDFGCTSDPRNIERGRPAVIPFLLFDRQIEWVDWVMDSWKNQRPGVNPKSRESGVSWLAIALSCTLCLFNDDMVIGFGSRKAELVDHIGDPDSLFWKARAFMELIPAEFKGSWSVKSDAPEKRIKFPSTNSIIKGEGGDDIGRGGRCGIYFVDESAFLQHPDMAEASLSQTTNCRIDISTPHGMGNPFYRKVSSWPPERIFFLSWRDDPRKDEVWYAKQAAELDPVTLAQEVDIDFSASIEGVLIPSAWVQASIDAHLKLNFEPTGSRSGSLDVADEGKDQNAFCGSYGPVLEVVEEWSGKGGDIFSTVQRAFGICDEYGYRGFKFDADGLGAGVRGDARVVNETRQDFMRLEVTSFRGSGPVINPEGEDVKGRKNQDFFANQKAQSWWSLRTRFQNTFRAVVEGLDVSPDALISIPSGMPNRLRLCSELSQPTFSVNGVGKIVIDKAPDGSKSPNMADSVMIQFSLAGRPPMRISVAALYTASGRPAETAQAPKVQSSMRISAHALMGSGRHYSTRHH